MQWAIKQNVMQRCHETEYKILANPDISRVIRPFFRGFFSVTKYINATFDNMNKYAFKCMQNFKQNIFTQITGLA